MKTKIRQSKQLKQKFGSRNNENKNLTVETVNQKREFKQKFPKIRQSKT